MGRATISALKGNLDHAYWSSLLLVNMISIFTLRYEIEYIFKENNFSLFFGVIHPSLLF